MTRTVTSAIPRIAVSLFLLLGLGCKRKEAPAAPAAPAMTQQEMAKAALPPNHPPLGMNHPGATMPNIPPPPRPSDAETMSWDLPKGWTEARPGGMRLATLKPPGQEKVDVSIVTLPGQAGGELGNVNRWRGQVGLPPVDEAGRLKLHKEVKSKAGAISLYDFTGEGATKQRMVVGLLFVDGRSWFIKMVGEADAVQGARTGFVSLLESLRLPDAK